MSVDFLIKWLSLCWILIFIEISKMYSLWVMLFPLGQLCFSLFSLRWLARCPLHLFKNFCKAKIESRLILIYFNSLRSLVFLMGSGISSIQRLIWFLSSCMMNKRLFCLASHAERNQAVIAYSDEVNLVVSSVCSEVGWTRIKVEARWEDCAFCWLMRVPWIGEASGQLHINDRLN